jgi:hypothetical protein
VACGSGGGGGTGINWIPGGWSPLITYQVNDAVSYNGSSYIAVGAHTNSQPPSGFWNVLAQSGSTGPTGATGPTGPTGPTGATGAAGSQIYSYAGLCPGGIGSIGDFCLNNTNGDYYFKTGVSTWTISGNLRGPAGSGGVPGGSNGQVQVNLSGVFGGVDATGTGNFLRESAVLALGSGNARKLVGQNAAGTDTVWLAMNRMAPLTASNAGLDLVIGRCTYRDTVDGGYFESISIESTDGGSTFVTGSITMTFAATTDGTTYNTIGTVALSSASRAVDSTLSGWTRDVAAGANSRVRGCVTSVSAGMKHVVFSPRFRPQN